MSNKTENMKRILELTRNESWQYDRLVVAEVQKLSKPLWKEKRANKKSGRKIEVWCHNRLAVVGTVDYIGNITGLSRNTIWRKIKEGSTDSKGRKFLYCEQQDINQ